MDKGGARRYAQGGQFPEGIATLERFGALFVVPFVNLDYTHTDPVSLFRKVLPADGYKFANGTVLPQGSFINVAMRSIHHDPGIYILKIPRRNANRKTLVRSIHHTRRV